MGTVEIEAEKSLLIRQLLDINDMDSLNKIRSLLLQLSKPKTESTNTDAHFVAENHGLYITKEELLDGIDAGLKDVKQRRTRPVNELLDEL